jgi:phage-related protein
MVGRINESDAMSEFGSTLKDWLPILTKAGKQLVELGGIAFDTVFPAIEVLVLVVSKFLQAVEPVARFIVNDLNPALLDFFDAVQRRVAVGARVMSDFFDKADAGFKIIGDAIKTAVDTADDALSTWNQIIRSVEAAIQDVIIDFAGDAWDQFTDDISEAKKIIEQDINGVIGFFQDLEQDAIDALEPVIDFIEDLQAAVNDIVKRLNQFEGVNLPQLDKIPDVEGDGEGGGIFGAVGRTVGRAFEEDTAEGKKLQDVATTFGGLLGDTAVDAGRIAKDRIDQRERNEVNIDSVNVDATGSELGDNPRRDSRVIGEQIEREVRETEGTNP